MKLHDLKPAPGSTKRRKRVGRGIAAGQGKTAGRGTKGQNARAGGGVPPYFEGGQLPLVRKLPFVRGQGFFNPWKVEFQPVNIYELAAVFIAGEVVSLSALKEQGLLKSERELVVVLGEGEIDIPLTVQTHRISKSARAKIEAAGGSVELLPWKRGGRRTR
ncbi:MAG: 50S ribosomal protein L15 [Chloroflexota bacterium]|nr:50S ribosomal protein L15 [Chloroflexota bacterium]